MVSELTGLRDVVRVTITESRGSDESMGRPNGTSRASDAEEAPMRTRLFRSFVKIEQDRIRRRVGGGEPIVTC